MNVELEEVQAYWKQNGLSGDPTAFWEYFQQRGWRAYGQVIRRWRRQANAWSRHGGPTVWLEENSGPYSG